MKKIETFKELCVNKIKELSEEGIYYGREDYKILRSIRNAIAHLHIEVSNNKMKIDSVQLTDYDIVNNKR